MTKKDYIIIASAIDRACGGNYTEAVKDVADALADVLHRDNEKFNRSKFLDACGIKQLDKNPYRCGFCQQLKNDCRCD